MKLHYKVRGYGPPLILTPGLGGTANDWEFFQEQLSGHHSVLIWDHRGHGQSEWSEKPADYDPRLLSTDLAFLSRKVGGSVSNPVVLMGHSLGGYSSLRFALERQELVRALILIATGPGFTNADHRSAWNEKVFAFDLGDSISPLARRLGVQRDSFVAENMGTLRVPTLFLVGEKDRVFMRAHDYFMNNVARSVSCVIRDAGHNLHKTHRTQVLNAVSNFLQNLPTSASPS